LVGSINGQTGRDYGPALGTFRIGVQLPEVRLSAFSQVTPVFLGI